MSEAGGELERFDIEGLSEREIAFQVWALLADRSPKRTAETCARDYGLILDTRKISVWAGRYNWLGQARQLLSETAPTFLERAASSLVGGAPDAARFLIAATNGEGWATLDNGQVDRGRVVAAVAVLDRVGFLPNTRKEAAKSGVPVHASRSADVWASLSDEELDAIIAGRVDLTPGTEP